MKDDDGKRDAGLDDGDENSAVEGSNDSVLTEIEKEAVAGPGAALVSHVPDHSETEAEREAKERRTEAKKKNRRASPRTG